MEGVQGLENTFCLKQVLLKAGGKGIRNGVPVSSAFHIQRLYGASEAFLG